MATQERREQDRARRKQDILLAARAVFAQDGFRRATVDQIAQQAEVAKGTIYLYFESKETILADLVLLALGDLSAQLNAANDGPSLLHPDEKLRAMADAYLAFAQRAPDYFRLLTTFERSDLAGGISSERLEQIQAESNRALDLVAQAVADGMALGLFAPGDARQIAGALWAALNGALTLMAHPVRRALVATDAISLYHLTLALCLKGLACPTPSKRSAL